MDYDKLARGLAIEVTSSTDAVATDKVAVKPSTEKFVEWAIMKNDRVSRTECAKFFERQGVPHKAFVEKSSKRGTPLAKGEMVIPNKDKVPGHLQDVLIPAYDNQPATVVDVDGDDVILKFEDSALPQLLRVDGGVVGPKAGIYRHTPASAALNGPDGENRSSKLFEIVYISDKTAPPPDKRRIEQVQKYVDRGADKGEERSRIYYSGLCLSTNDAKSGSDRDWFFRIFSQQRDTFPRSLNPTKGQVLYLGRLNKRPSGWEDEYDEWVRQAIVDSDQDGGDED